MDKMKHSNNKSNNNMNSYLEYNMFPLLKMGAV